MTRSANSRRDRHPRLAFGAAALAAFVTGVAAHPGAATADTDTVTVFAAASLKNAVDDIVEDWETRTGKTAAVSYAGSSTLAKQIEQGAPADIFMSADLEWMDYLSGKGLTVKESERVLS